MQDIALITSELKIAIAINALLFLGLAWYYKKYPPKNINWLYGYRTNRSMANNDIWKAANDHSANTFWKLALTLLISGAVFIVFSVPYGLLIHVGILLIGLGVSVYATEAFLNRHFDKNGKRK